MFLFRTRPQLFTVPEVLPKRMAGRLEQICRLEALRHDRHALGDLCQLADGVRPSALRSRNDRFPAQFRITRNK